MAGVLACAPLGAGGPGPALAQDVDLDEVFRCVEPEAVDPEQCLQARDLILNNCTVCHTFVPIVLQPYDAGGWRGLLDRHHDRISLTQDQVDLIHQYLTANFNAELEPPWLPEELLKTWTAY